MPDDATGGTPTAPKTSPFSTRVRVVQLSFLALAVLATIGLAWWQWDRWTSGDGSFQNLGYALQWPVFGAFFIVAYRKYMEYERDRLSGEETPAAPEPSPEDAPREIPQDVLPQRPTADSDPFVDDRRQQARNRTSDNRTPDTNRTS
ncbi:MAG: hypothetical protein ACTIL2_11725 [Corynebacterium sp.]|uniref:hypothetical protein n=1 Tax=Corynebacterium sp. TaxID=1720 RepID=UPI003F94F6B9